MSKFALKLPMDQAVMLAAGGGADSTALGMKMVEQGQRIDAALFADTGGEKPGTMRYIYEVLQPFFRKAGIRFEIVKYVPHKFKNFPPYYTLEDNCLSNGTLPSLTFGFSSCAIKWKVVAQEKWAKIWPLAQKTWERGKRIIKLIGYDAGKRDARRANHTGSIDNPEYEFQYPLIGWGWTREDCLDYIVDQRLPGWHPSYLQGEKLRWVRKGGIPMKSACFFCPANKPWELHVLDSDPEKQRDMLRRIVTMEARAQPRFRKVEGLWRKATKKRPGSMTEYIRLNGMLPESEIDALQKAVPKELVQRVEDWREGEPIEDWDEFRGRMDALCDTTEIGGEEMTLFS